MVFKPTISSFKESIYLTIFRYRNWYHAKAFKEMHLTYIVTLCNAKTKTEHFKFGIRLALKVYFLDKTYAPNLIFFFSYCKSQFSSHKKINLMIFISSENVCFVYVKDPWKEKQVNINFPFINWYLIFLHLHKYIFYELSKLY